MVTMQFIGQGMTKVQTAVAASPCKPPASAAYHLHQAVYHQTNEEGWVVGQVVAVRGNGTYDILRADAGIVNPGWLPQFMRPITAAVVAPQRPSGVASPAAATVTTTPQGWAVPAAPPTPHVVGKATPQRQQPAVTIYHPQPPPPATNLQAMHVRRDEREVRQQRRLQRRDRFQPPHRAIAAPRAHGLSNTNHSADVRRPADATLLIEHMQVGLVIGRRGAMIRRIEHDTGCHVQVQKDHEIQERSLAKRTIFVRAPLGVYGDHKKAMVSDCVQYISRMLAAQTVGK